MVTYHKLKTRTALFQRIVGLTVSEFEILHDTFVSIYDQFITDTFRNRRDRARAYGGGNTPRLASTEDMLVFILIYFRIYPLQIIQGMWFGMDESVANRWIHRLTPLIKDALQFKRLLPKRKRGRTLKEIEQDFPDLKDFLIDGMERPIRRPKNKDSQKSNYSGKKKRYTKKNITISDTTKGYIHGIGQTQAGSIHDKTAADEEGLSGTSDIDIGADLGFMGFVAGNARIITPTKKPKGQELSPDIKAQNKIFCSMRIVIEHAHSGIKRSHIIADTFRNTKQGYDDQVMLISAGLHNLRVMSRYH